MSKPESDSRGLIVRLLDTPQLALAVPRLSPEVLHRIVQSCGLEECGELLTLATPAQLASVFDLDLWRADQPGMDEQFDAGRFGVWLELLVESGDTLAAQIVAQLDPALVTAALAQHARVFDLAASPVPPLDEDALATAGGFRCEVGGYLIVATRPDAWDAIVAVLMALDAGHNHYFHRVMAGCRRLSNSRPEIDGLHQLLTDQEQVVFDLAAHRERRREQQGYVTPAQARAFLQMSRQFRLGPDTMPPVSPMAQAYFRAMEWTGAADATDLPPMPDRAEAVPAVAAVVETLLDAGVLPQPPRALLDGTRGAAPRLARIQRHLQFVHDSDPAAYTARTQEFAYLANTIVAGCSMLARPMTTQEASDAVVAACNLGLENWPGPALADDFLVGHDLVSAFQVGWAVLHQEVCLFAAEELMRVLAGLRCGDRETQAGVDALRRALRKHCPSGMPWRARDALDVIEILDMPAWAALRGLIDECPVLHAGIAASQDARTRSVSASAFEFISENRQIASIREFMRSLPDTLRD